jgi:hypothetical protein
MAKKEDFSEQEWETLRKGAMGAGMLVSISDRGFFDSFKEAGALAKHVAKARENQSSELLRDLAGERGTGFGVTDSPAEVEQGTLDALRSATELLQQKAPDELPAYREFVIGVARSVAEAASGGENEEALAIGKITDALGSPAS